MRVDQYVRTSILDRTTKTREMTIVHQENGVDRRLATRGAAEWTSKATKQPKATGGKRKKSKAENLAIRFRLYIDTVLRFIHDVRIPFDNNQAERDLRMVKVKQKVSRAFRTTTGAEWFARLRGFISTCLKQNIPVLASLTDATRGQFLFQTT
ncbi:Transposase IS66 family protein [Paenibacillaceae bacterium GAS479]|nr:Transposase IS66 family protein [Paenibacillaceae bacterium GAS479]